MILNFFSSPLTSRHTLCRHDIRQISAVRAILELVFIRSVCLEFSVVRAFLHAKLMLLFSFSAPVNFYFLTVCVPCVRFS